MHHTGLNQEKWNRFSLVEQMANIGSEVIRAMKWSMKNKEYSKAANIRALELFDLSLNAKFQEHQLKEIARSRELWLDYFLGSNKYNQTESQWEKYFLAFNVAARNQAQLPTSTIQLELSGV